MVDSVRVRWFPALENAENVVFRQTPFLPASATGLFDAPAARVVAIRAF
jgi:hypothetical protein